MILQFRDTIKNFEKAGSPCEAYKKQLKEYEDLYRYHYEGGSRPAHMPSSSNDMWVGCSQCE